MRKESTMRRLLCLGSMALLIGAPGVQAAEKYPVSCLGSGSTITGTYGSETIYGTNGRDTISALAGDDSVHALAGEDRICGGPGADIISDGYGRDEIDGGDGFDTLYLCPDGAADIWRNVERVVQTSLGCR
jgi:Ca2+-binding RTX toxin-like protein